MTTLLPAARAVVNLRDYPIEQLDGADMVKRIAGWQRSYHELGVCVLHGFIAPDKLPWLVAEATELLPLRHKHTVVGNPYLTAVDDTAPSDHPVRMTDRTTTSTVAYDQIPPGMALRQLYESPAVDELVRRIVGCSELFHYACPMGAVNIAVMEEGDYLRWHFDQSEFVVSIHLQDSEAGGHYEYIRDLRSADEPNYAGVKAALQGDRQGVKRLDNAPGSLILFRGINTLHRVTEVRGERPRLVLLYGYAEGPGVDSSDFLKLMRYGRTTPIAAASTR
jgi:hypothetical protein